MAAAKTETRLLAHVNDADLVRLGIDSNTMVIARLLSTEAELAAMEKMIPEAQYNALFGLACGQTPEEVWAEVSQYAPRDPVDTSDIVMAMERTPGRVVFIGSNKELERILEHPFAAWRIFLHPAQRKIAYAARYAGPAQVTGGAGTGKTVTALHRAAHLARRASEEPYAAGEVRPVLLTTFTRNLADALETQFDLLVDTDDVRRQVEILNVDRLAYRVAEQSRGTRPAIIDNKHLADLWAAAASKAGLPFAPTFLIREWEQVILAQDLQAEQEYLTCSRAGQGMPLGKTQRRQVWQLLQQVESELKEMGQSTFLQLANEWPLSPRIRPTALPASDRRRGAGLAPGAVALLRAAVAEGPNDMFIVGDAHQRIYDNHVSLAKVGINVRGRSRTTDRQLPHHAGDPGASRTRAWQGADHRAGRRGGFACWVPVSAARTPTRGAFDGFTGR